MKIFPNRSLINHHGKTVKESDAADAPESRLGAFLTEGFLRDLPGDQGTGEGGKVYRWKLAQGVTRFMEEHKDKEAHMDIAATDVAMVQKRLESFMPTVLLGPIMEAIEPTIEAVAKKN